MTAQTIPADAAYYVAVKCPQCGADEVIPVTLQARLTKTRDQAKLSVRAAQKAQDHACGQLSVTVVGGTGEIIDPAQTRLGAVS